MRLREAAKNGTFVQAAKTRAERNYGASTPPSFKRFTYTETADKLLLGLVKFFHAQFRHVSLAVALDKARRQHLEGVKPDVVTATIGDLHAEELRHKLELGPVYCAVVLQCSNFRNTVKDKLFFEAFQSFTTGNGSPAVLVTCMLLRCVCKFSNGRAHGYARPHSALGPLMLS